MILEAPGGKAGRRIAKGESRMWMDSVKLMRVTKITFKKQLFR